MKIAISGASGFIGSYLSKYFIENGHQVFPLTRTLFLEDSDSKLKAILSESEIVINLSGAPINHRWTELYKKELCDSRMIPTRKMVNAINSLSQKPKLFISASAVGYYPSEGCYDEYNSIKGESFLSDICQQWEEEAKQLSPTVRLVIARLGVVLAAEGGAFEKIIFPLKLGIAPIIGKGNQPFPWIGIADLANAFLHFINNTEKEGVVNFVAPEKITNKELMKRGAKHYRSLFTINVPALVFRILLGESATLVLEGQCVEPKKLLESGFKFESASIQDFLSSLSKK